jgi:peptidoglycan/xylan/chitin deacetylase (PgdA/CDA1 family)
MAQTTPSSKPNQIAPQVLAVLVVVGIFALMAGVVRPWERFHRALGQAIRLAVFVGVAVVFVGSGLMVAMESAKKPVHLSGIASRPPHVLQAQAAAVVVPTPPPEPTVGVTVPILMYHDTPANFEEQLVYLEQHGYSVIDMDTAIRGMQGKALPAKPVVLTFDDGYANQMEAFGILKRHNVRATFYIIAGGEASAWCLGASRRYGDPVQPPGGCGDAYLNWDQVRELDRSGLVTIGGHTVNHRDLAVLSEADQKFEIAVGKEMLEAELGHKIRHFAYPYGSYNAESLRIVREVGYVTAVTTESGDYQPGGAALTLHRMRDALVLP